MNLEAASRYWDEHWQSLAKRSWFGFAALATRRLIFQKAVAYYVRRFFPESGVFVEMGCGTAESSALISRTGRTLVGLDFSAVALSTAQTIGCMDGLVQADVLSLPCRTASLRGIWNLGVMEHFTQSQIRLSLQEFHRVLEPDGIVLLFWPSEHNASRWILGPIERILSFSKRRKFAFFPDEVNRLRSRTQAREFLEGAGFEVLAIDFTWRTALIHMVLVANKGT